MLEATGEATRAEWLVQRYCDVRARTERIAEPLSPEDQTVQSMPDVSPTKWHSAHVTWFFETFVLGPHAAGYEPFHPRYGFLFNSYYEAIGERHPRPERGLVTRPGVTEIGAYRGEVDRQLRQLLDRADGALLDLLLPLIRLGTHHEEQHQELMLMDIKHVLSRNSLEPAYLPRRHSPQDDPGPAGWVEVEGGVVPIGRPGDADGFGFDNEGPRHDALLHPHRLADRLVTSGEWIDFMADGGYRRPELWLSDGWYARQREDWQAPLYWRPDGDAWSVHTMAGVRPVDPHEPVCHVSFYEADAFATWSGRRLPTEFEWEHAAAGQAVAGNFLASDPLDGSLHPQPAGPGDGGLRQLLGDCWEWTGSPYRPYPGYRPPEGAIGEYNGKFMINTMVLRGGCAFTPGGHTRSTYRNFFHPHTRWHLSGVRLADDA
jgi:ergothioneine biosynthesis protein EgtB